MGQVIIWDKCPYANGTLEGTVEKGLNMDKPMVKNVTLVSGTRHLDAFCGVGKVGVLTLYDPPAASPDTLLKQTCMQKCKLVKQATANDVDRQDIEPLFLQYIESISTVEQLLV